VTTRTPLSVREFAPAHGIYLRRPLPHDTYDRHITDGGIAGLRKVATRGLPALLAAGALAVAGASTFGRSSTASAITKPHNTPCGYVAAGKDATAKLQVVGSQMQDTLGRVITPYGISIVGGPETFHFAKAERQTRAQIIAAARYWHANTQRIQVSENVLFQKTPGYGYNRPFLLQVDRLICTILKLHEIPVLNNNPMFTGNEPQPRPVSVRFWEFMARRYRALPVIYDLFNEPRLSKDPVTKAKLAVDHVWQLWQDGGTVGGAQYVGMQRLVDAIRIKARAQNVIWVEGPYLSGKIELFPQHLLKGSNLVYAFHKGSIGEGTTRVEHIRALALLGIPLVDGEWSQFASPVRPWECLPHAPQWVPQFLTDLKQLNIGLIAWSLQPGALVAGVDGQDTVHDGNDTRYTTNPARLALPNTFKSNYGCTQEALGQGFGAQIQSYFQQTSRPIPPELFPRFR
jgi:hypothetical protein